MKKNLLIPILTVSLILATGCMGQQKNQTTNGNTNTVNQTNMNSNTDSTQIITTTADKLIAEFTKNSTLATEKYTGKRVQITGNIFERGSPKDNIPKTNASLVVFGEYEKAALHIICYFDDVVVIGLRKGDNITVTANFVHYQSSDVWKEIRFEKGQIEKVNSKAKEE